MRPNVRIVGALAFSIVFAGCLSVWAIAQSQDRTGLAVAELLRIEAPPDGEGTILDEQLYEVFQVVGGERRWTEADLADRFSPAFAEAFTVDELNRGLDAVFAQLGTVSFVRTVERGDDIVLATAVAENGHPLTATIALAPDGRMRTMGLDELPSPALQRGWETGLALGAGWLFLAVAFASTRAGHRRDGRWLAAGSAASFAAVLVLARNEVLYTVGRTVPALLLIVVAVLLSPTGVTPMAARWPRVLAASAAAALVVAPITRDARRIGHPGLVARLADDDTIYHVMLAAGATVMFAAMTALAVANGRSLRRLSTWRRPAGRAATADAGLLAVAALGASLDVAFGDGRWAGGALAAVAWVGIGAVPVVVAFGLASARWDRPELASLVIDLDSDSNLETAVADALGDHSVRVLTSENGVALVDDAGNTVEVGQIPPGRALTLIRSRGTLVGGLVHDSALNADPSRIEAVAAAAGLALDVGRLNRQVVAQLDDVRASRARIVQASDDARRRVERDLHDGAQQRLVALGLKLQRARRTSLADGNPAQAELLDAATAEIREILDDIRSVSRGSLPPLLAERGLAPAVDALAERAPVPVHIDAPVEALPPHAAATVYYVVAEALTNIAKHADATRASVSICRRNGAAHVRVVDDGRGGATGAPGSGLQGLDDRVAAAGGSFAIDSGPGGTRLEATIPCA